MKSALLQANSILEGMTDPFPGFLLESRVIIDKAQVTNALSSFIDDNSRLEKKSVLRFLLTKGMHHDMMQKLANLYRFQSLLVIVSPYLV